MLRAIVFDQDIKEIGTPEIPKYYHFPNYGTCLSKDQIEQYQQYQRAQKVMTTASIITGSNTSSQGLFGQKAASATSPSTAGQSQSLLLTPSLKK